MFMYVCFSLNVGAYLSETFRGAILSVNRGQIEAAQSLGMTEVQVMRRVVIPQALQVALPNMGNTFISLRKDTSLAFAASVPEIMGQRKSAARTSYFFEAYIVAALIYWIFVLFSSVSLRRQRSHAKAEREFHLDEIKKLYKSFGNNEILKESSGCKKGSVDVILGQGIWKIIAAALHQFWR